MPTKRARAAKPKPKTASKRRTVVPGAGNGGIIPPIESRFGPGNQAAVGHGRPRKLQDLKELILETLAEDLTDANGRRLTLTRAQAMIRTMLIKSPTDRIALLEYAFGKVPQAFAHLTWREYLEQQGIGPASAFERMVNAAAEIPRDAAGTPGTDGGGSVGSGGTAPPGAGGDGGE